MSHLPLKLGQEHPGRQKSGITVTARHVRSLPACSSDPSVTHHPLLAFLYQRGVQTKGSAS